MELHWKNLTLNEDWLQVRLCLSILLIFVHCKKKVSWEWDHLFVALSPLSVLSVITARGLVLPPAQVVLHRGTGRLCPSPPCVTCSCHLPGQSSTEGTSFPSLCCAHQLQAAPVLRFQHRTAQLNRAQQLRLNRAQLWARDICKALHKWRCSQNSVTAAPSVLGSVPGSTTLCAALLAPGSTELESWEQGKVRAFCVSKWPGLLKGPLCPLPDGCGCSEHPFLTALNPSSHGQHLQWAPQWSQVVSWRLSSSAPGPPCFPSPLWLQANKEYEIQYEIEYEIQYEGCPCRNNLGKKLIWEAGSLAQLSSKKKPTFYHKS